jgi:hypothetical protein
MRATNGPTGARLIEQWNENHHWEPMTVRDDTALPVSVSDRNRSI